MAQKTILSEINNQKMTNYSLIPQKQGEKIKKTPKKYFLKHKYIFPSIIQTSDFFQCQLFVPRAHLLWKIVQRPSSIFKTPRAPS